MHKSSDLLPCDEFHQIALPVDVEDDNRHIPVIAESVGSLVEDTQMLCHRLVEGYLIVPDCSRILLRVGRLDSVHTGPLQNHVSTDLKSSESCSGISREKRISGSSADEGHSPFLEHPDGIVAVVVPCNRLHRSG